ncbi:hypothetical protein [Nocardiopsis sp. JB363]|uniref:hypothetical protein n=1 Tax=Nocardiopsis sp. JB363 TaxID=1434837 RepID=UPI00097A4DA9|nr:hypothetical protein [Nocardiopsis sp. JB363]SIO84532.1 HNH endonuclease [Nocardiopsis sp. JB363]
MATFRTGQKTHQAVLPQRPALEPESVDTPRIGHETGLRHHPRVVSGADHVRGETTHIPPDVGGVTTQPLAGERPRERHPSVFVLDKNQVPLQPCHPATDTPLNLAHVHPRSRSGLEQRPPTHVGSGRRTRWNRTRDHLPKTHTLDALAVGKVDTTTHGTVQGIGHKYMRLLQRADGYGYTWKGEGVSSRL